MDYNKLKEELSELHKVYEKICGDDVDFTLEPPATEAEIKETEQKIGKALPKEIRDFFLCFSKDCDFSAYLPDEFELPEELSEIFSAGFRIALDEVADAEISRESWQNECFSDENDEYDRVWHNKLGIMTVANGDVIALDTGVNPQNPPVVYLSHDDGEGHGYILGKTFNAYLQALISVGGCGNEDWQVLPFCNDPQSGIDCDCENADTYRKLIGMGKR